MKNEVYTVRTDSPLFAPSLPHRSFNSFVRALGTMKNAIARRARDYGYEVKHTIAYEATEDVFVMEYVDMFGLTHTYEVVREWV